jgi:hypothetical protein
MILINKSANDLTPEDVERIFSLANKCYNFEVDGRNLARALNYLKGEGLQDVRSGVGIDYRPYMGAKFFINKVGDKAVSTSAYSTQEDLLGDEKDQRYKEGLAQLFEIISEAN